MPRNPIWTRDELILALELYFRVNPVRISAEHPEVLRLSVLLNELPIHTERPDEVRFRNPNGVYMKLCNFLRFDPNYEGIGLNRGGRLEREIWTEFAHDRARLIATARSIQAALRVVSSQEVVAELSSCDEEFPEGRLLTAVHRIRERNVSVVQRKKESVLAATGALECEACGFDFERTYGSLGSGFAECHHIIPLSKLARTTSTRLSDLAIVCANCHRIIHRSRPMLSVAELRELVQHIETSNKRIQWTD